MPYASGRALSSLGRRLMELPERRRQDELDARNRQFEDLDVDLLLAGAGGGRGAPPPLQRTLPGTIPPPDLGPSSLFPEPEGPLESSARELMPAPRFPEPTPITMQEPDERFVPVGAGLGYVEKPGVAEDRAALQAETGFRDAIAPFLPPELDAGQVARGVSAGVPSYLMFPPPEDPAIKRAEFYIGKGFGPQGQNLQGPRDDPDSQGNPTYAQAYDRLVDRYTVTTTDADGYAEEKLSLDPQQLHDLAIQLSRGKDVQLPPVTRPADDSAPAPVSGPTPLPGIGAWIERQLPGGNTGFAVPEPGSRERPSTSGMTRDLLARSKEPADTVTVQPGTDAAPLSQGELSLLQKEFEGMPREEAERILRRVGASDDQIRQVLGER